MGLHIISGRHRRTLPGADSADPLLNGVFGRLISKICCCSPAFQTLSPRGFQVRMK